MFLSGCTSAPKLDVNSDGRISKQEIIGGVDEKTIQNLITTELKDEGLNTVNAVTSHFLQVINFEGRAVKGDDGKKTIAKENFYYLLKKTSFDDSDTGKICTAIKENLLNKINVPLNVTFNYYTNYLEQRAKDLVGMLGVYRW